jgi:hypothetical protein
MDKNLTMTKPAAVEQLLSYEGLMVDALLRLNQTERLRVRELFTRCEELITQEKLDELLARYKEMVKLQQLSDEELLLI